MSNDTLCKFCGDPVSHNTLSLAVSVHQPCIDLAADEITCLRAERDAAVETLEEIQNRSAYMVDGAEINRIAREVLARIRRDS